jgi:hypothetical protein
MTRSSNGHTPQSQALRDAGYVRVPSGVWVTAEERDLILYMAEQHLDIINKIKGRFEYGTATKSHYS